MLKIHFIDYLVLKLPLSCIYFINSKSIRWFILNQKNENMTKYEKSKKLLKYAGKLWKQPENDKLGLSGRRLRFSNGYNRSIVTCRKHLLAKKQPRLRLLNETEISTRKNTLTAVRKYGNRSLFSCVFNSIPFQ